MKIVIIHSNKRKENTYKVSKQFQESLEQLTDLEIKEYTLSTDFPYFCTGCHSCFLNGEHTCGHFETLRPFAEEIEWADGVVLTSPVYVMGPTANMKAFLDHLGYMWLAHRPREENFKKVGMSLATAAGGGLSDTNKMMSATFKYLGFKRYYSFGCRVLDIEKPKTKKQLDQAAKKYYNAYAKREQLGQLPFQKLFFNIMKGMVKKYEPGSMLYRDREYWESKGWLGGKNPWK